MSSKVITPFSWSFSQVSGNMDPPPYWEHDDATYATRESLSSVLPRRPAVIAVMGPTGTGKSTFISKLARQDMNIGHNLSSCTQNCEEIPCKVGDKHVILVDTPGFNDTERSDTEILTLLADWMKESYSGDFRLSGIVYLHAISDTRMTNSSLQNLRMFRKLCGDDNLTNVILATTKWGITPQVDAYRRERELCSENGFWGTMIAAGSRIRRFENSTASAQFLVEEIIGSGNTFVPQIQREVVDGKKLSDTTAGVFLKEALIKLQEKHKQELEALKDEWKRAESSKDQKMQAALERERQQLKDKIAKQKEEQRTLNMDTVQALQERLRKLEGRTPRVKLRFWHSRYQCKLCKNGKTEVIGSWTCPKCDFVQINVPE